MSIPLPFRYDAVPPELRAKSGVPVTLTIRLNLTVTSMTAPKTYVPLAVGEVILFTVACTASTTMSLFAPREPAAPGVGKVRTASDEFPWSLIVPPLSVSAPVAE